MDIAAAKLAGSIAASIEARNEKISLLERAISEQWRIIEARARNQETGEETTLVLGTLDNETSNQALLFIKSIYDAQKASLESELAAIV